MIIRQVQLHGVQHQLSVGDIIQLYQLGVSEPIMIAMQGAAPLTVGQQVTVEPLPLPPPPSAAHGTSYRRSYGTE